MTARTIAELRLKVAQLELAALAATETRSVARAGTVAGKRSNLRHSQIHKQLDDYRELLAYAEEK